jgi:starch synthase
MAVSVDAGQHRSAEGADPPVSPKDALRVLHVTSEVEPLVKTGGLADVSAALPAALREEGVDARLLVPAYPSVLAGCGPTREWADLEVVPGRQGRVLEGRLPPNGMPLYVLDCPELFLRDGGPYQDDSGQDWVDNDLRFAALGRAGARLAAGPVVGWAPDLVHAHDWQAGLAPACLVLEHGRAVPSILTVHNLSFPGAFPAERLPLLGLPASAYGPEGLEFYGRLSFLKAGLSYSDWLSTVSPTYAREIQTEAFGGGFDGLLRARSDRLTGILNGIDTRRWDPAHDPHLPAAYHPGDLAGKALARSALQAAVGLPEEGRAPLLGVVSRLAWQKGIDLVPPALDALADRGWQLVILGRGEAELERALTAWAVRWPQRVRIVNRLDETLAHLVEAGSDLFLMPSRFEPCGLNQMYSLRYGTPPVVRRTGGLADTVVDALPATIADGTATGFVFDEAQAPALSAAVARALDLWAQPAVWARLQACGMAQNLGWGPSAKAYAALYRQVLASA